MSTYTLIVRNIAGDALYVSESDSLRGIKGAATRKLRSMTRDLIPVSVEVVDGEGFAHYSETNEHWDWEQNEARKQAEQDAHGEGLVTESTPSAKGKRQWKVVRSGGPNRSFGTEAAAKDYADTLADRHVEVRFGDTRQPRECGCGCGDQTKGGRFLPGHDRRFFVLAGKAIDGDEVAARRVSKAGIPALFGDVDAVFDESVRCDSACEFAEGTTCRCSCGGDNHRAGWAVLEAALG